MQQKLKLARNVEFEIKDGVLKVEPYHPPYALSVLKDKIRDQDAIVQYTKQDKIIKNINWHNENFSSLVSILTGARRIYALSVVPPQNTTELVEALKNNRSLCALVVHIAKDDDFGERRYFDRSILSNKTLVNVSAFISGEGLVKDKEVPFSIFTTRNIYIRNLVEELMEPKYESKVGYIPSHVFTVLLKVELLDEKFHTQFASNKLEYYEELEVRWRTLLISQAAKVCWAYYDLGEQMEKLPFEIRTKILWERTVSECVDILRYSEEHARKLYNQNYQLS